MVGISPDQQRFQVLIDHGFDRQRALLEGSATVAADAFIGGHSYGNQIMSVGASDKTFDIFNEGWRHQETPLQRSDMPE